jgi:hypothetical protein
VLSSFPAENCRVFALVPARVSLGPPNTGLTPELNHRSKENKECTKLNQCIPPRKRQKKEKGQDNPDSLNQVEGGMCDVCGKHFRQVRSLKNHRADAHPHEPAPTSSFKCLECAREFPDANAFAQVCIYFVLQVNLFMEVYACLKHRLALHRVEPPDALVDNANNLSNNSFPLISGPLSTLSTQDTTGYVVSTFPPTPDNSPKYHNLTLELSSAPSSTPSNPSNALATSRGEVSVCAICEQRFAADAWQAHLQSLQPAARRAVLLPVDPNNLDHSNNLNIPSENNWKHPDGGPPAVTLNIPDIFSCMFMSLQVVAFSCVVCDSLCAKSGKPKKRVFTNLRALQQHMAMAHTHAHLINQNIPSTQNNEGDAQPLGSHPTLIHSRQLSVQENLHNLSQGTDEEQPINILASI